MSDLRQAAQQALQALELGYDSAKAEADQYHAAMAGYRPQRHAEMDADVQKIAAAITALRAALAEQEGGGNLPPPLQEPAIAKNARAQQQLEDAPPSEYRRGYWDGFNIGKREGRIEAADAPAEPTGKEGLQVEPPQCNPHPKAPHGYLRNASHTEDRYVCECEYWDPYEAGYQAGMEAAMQLQKDDDWK